MVPIKVQGLPSHEAGAGASIWAQTPNDTEEKTNGSAKVAGRQHCTTGKVAEILGGTGTNQEIYAGKSINRSKVERTGQNADPTAGDTGRWHWPSA